MTDINVSAQPNQQVTQDPTETSVAVRQMMVVAKTITNTFSPN